MDIVKVIVGRTLVVRILCQGVRVLHMGLIGVGNVVIAVVFRVEGVLERIVGMWTAAEIIVNRRPWRSRVHVTVRKVRNGVL